MKTMLLAAVLGLAACGGTETTNPVAGRWQFRVGDVGDAYELHGIVDLREDGTGEALRDGCDPVAACALSGPVRWSDTNGVLRVDFYMSNPASGDSDVFAETSLDLPLARGIFHSPENFAPPAAGFVAKHL